jgi:predicted nucleotide-binding protein
MTKSKQTQDKLLEEYLASLQEIHRIHQRSYQEKDAHPQIHQQVDKLDNHLENIHELMNIKDLKTQIKNYEPKHNLLRSAIKKSCKHRSVQVHLESAKTIEEKNIQQLFYKYHLNLQWLQEIKTITSSIYQKIVEYLHEVLLTLDLSYQLRSLATIYAK